MKYVKEARGKEGLGLDCNLFLSCLLYILLLDSQSMTGLEIGLQHF
jgi:hypothetical protein